jgi:hypothetical protein
MKWCRFSANTSCPRPSAKGWKSASRPEAVAGQVQRVHHVRPQRVPAAVRVAPGSGNALPSASFHLVTGTRSVRAEDHLALHTGIAEVSAAPRVRVRRVGQENLTGLSYRLQ